MKSVFMKMFAKPLACRLLFSAILAIGFEGIANAQYIEHVYLKNGSIIRGVVIEQIPEENIKIMTSDGSLFVYRYDEVAKITKTPQNGTQYRTTPQGKPVKELTTPRYEGGVSFIASPINFNVGVSTTHGCLITPNLYIGAGVGFYYHDTKYGSYFAIPIFGDVRAYFLQGDVQPYINASVGYDFSANGIYMSPTIGLRYKLLDVGIGCTMNRVTQFYYDYYYTYQQRRFLISLNIKIGFRF